MTLAEFKSLVDTHDFFYNYSDDHSVYTYYNNKATRIFQYIEMLEGDAKQEAINYYNSIVEKKVVESEVEKFKI